MNLYKKYDPELKALARKLGIYPVRMVYQFDPSVSIGLQIFETQKYIWVIWQDLKIEGCYICENSETRQILKGTDAVREWMK